MRAVGYRVHMMVVLCSHATCLERAAARKAKTGREVPRAIIDKTFKSLQAAVPTYLRQHASITERLLVYTNDSKSEPSLEFVLSPFSSPHLVPKAIELAKAMLALPGDDKGNVDFRA